MFEAGAVYSLSHIIERLCLSEDESERLRQDLNGKAASIDEYGIVYYRGCDIQNALVGVIHPQQLVA